MSGYSALMMTVMYRCIQTVWKTIYNDDFVCYVCGAIFSLVLSRFWQKYAL